ncbi:6-phosphogluconolactonase [Streptomyces sp. MK5]|uniref:6-phosphogluconolactonase n=1 Tax=Streptomyces sp. MK5 TaxID=3064253 RepID=UPI002741A72A|nr:6-phosphogluconolactonase [Streptomyces sp. MK5]
MSLLTVFPDAEALGAALAAEIVAGMADAAAQGRRYLLGCPGGRSLIGTYEAVAGRLRSAPMDLAHVVIVMMDDYLDDVPGPVRRVPADALHSCERFARLRIAEPWSRAVGPGRGIREEHVWVPDPGDPPRYDERIAAAGGIDLFLLATGASDGHIAFNPPGCGLAEGTRVIRLAESTRRDNLVTFPHLGTLDQVPRRGVSVGPATIAGLSRRVRLVATGADKAKSVARVRAAGRWEPDWPATIVHASREAEIWTDPAAAGGSAVAESPSSPHQLDS